MPAIVEHVTCLRSALIVLRGGGRVAADKPLAQEVHEIVRRHVGGDPGVRAYNGVRTRALGEAARGRPDHVDTKSMVENSAITASLGPMNGNHGRAQQHHLRWAR